MLCSGRLFHCAVRGAPAVGGECGVDLVAQAANAAILAGSVSAAVLGLTFMSAVCKKKADPETSISGQSLN